MKKLEDQIADLVLGVAHEWLRYATLSDGTNVRCEWHEDGEGETLHVENLNADVRWRFQITVQAKSLPPLGPENDLGVHGIDETETTVWVERVMADVRPGDTIRMVGQEGTRREVAGALHVPWHVADVRSAGSVEQAQDIQYNPHRYRQQWSEIRLAFSDGGKYSFDPMMKVEILLSPGEVAAVEAIGWEHRIGLTTRSADED